jgi:hypothetical protein
LSKEKSTKSKKDKKNKKKTKKSVELFGFPTMSQIEKAINNAVKPIKTAIDSFVKTVRNEARKIIGPIVAAVKGSYDTVKTAVDGAVVFIKLVVAGYDKWNVKAFRTRLDGFFDDLLKLAGEPGRILLDLNIDINPKFIQSIIKDMPAIVLYPVAQGLESISGWDKGPAKLLAVATSVPSLNDQEQRLCRDLLAQPELAVTVRDARLLVKVVEKTLDLAISLLPKDLSVNVSVLGEGGGTEVAGHPAKVPFETAKWITSLTDQAFTAYLNRYGACAQSAYQKSVMEKLDAIEAAVGAKS